MSGLPTPPPGFADQPISVRAIYAILRREIITLRLKPGMRLTENELADHFGTSRAPVREALIRLVEDGLIDVRPQRGSFVSRISLRATERARFVRQALEVAIVRHAAERGISDEARSRLDSLIALQIANADDPSAFNDADDLFHQALAEAADQASVWSIVEREKAQFDRVRFLSLPRATPVETLVGQHRAVVAGIVSRRPEDAEAAIRRHMSEVLKVVHGLADRHPDLILSDL